MSLSYSRRVTYTSNIVISFKDHCKIEILNGTPPRKDYISMEKCLVLTVFRDVDGSLGKWRRGGEEGQREEEQGKGGGAWPSIAHPPKL